MKNLLIITLFCLLWFANVYAQNKKQPIKKQYPDVSIFEDAVRHFNDTLALQFKFERYKPSQIKEIAWNIVRYQNSDGGWPKNLDWLAIIEPDSVRKLLNDHYKQSTLDNRNTFSHVEYLAQAYMITREKKFKDSAERGLDYIFNTQRTSGGWRGWDVEAITYNDEVMTGIMTMLKDIKEGKEHFRWIDETRKRKAELALSKAIDVTLKCQITIDGTKTGWCQQHDHETLRATKARAYELPSVSSLETAAVVKFLMLIKNPPSEVSEAIISAVDWMKKSKISGVKIVTDKKDSSSSVYNSRRPDKILIKDKSAQPIWARFYDIETNIPFFCNRDGIKVYFFSEILPERRRSYAWYGYWPAEILNNLYPKWKKQNQLK